MMIYLFLFMILGFILSIVKIYNTKIEHFIEARGGHVEFFYKRECGLCPKAREKILKRLDKRTSFSDRNITRVMCKKQICSPHGECYDYTYEDWEVCEDGKRAESLSISHVPTVVITGGNAIVILTLTEEQVNKM